MYVTHPQSTRSEKHTAMSGVVKETGENFSVLRYAVQ